MRVVEGSGAVFAFELEEDVGAACVFVIESVGGREGT